MAPSASDAPITPYGPSYPTVLEGVVSPGASRAELFSQALAAFAGPQRGPLTAEEIAAATAMASSYADATYALLRRLEQERALQPDPSIQPIEEITQPQRAMRLGEPVPVVFCRHRNSRGGVMNFPPATEVRTWATPAGIGVAYHCVLGMGDLDNVQVWQVRHMACRVGQYSQNYDKRAGSWEPGNYAQPLADYELPEFPVVCGGGGDYAGLSTIEFSHTFPADTDAWKGNWNVFHESGMPILRGRILDNVVGPSDNIVDLWLWWRQQNGRIPDDMIDIPSLTKAAKFVEHYGLLCNAVFSATTDLVNDVLPWFLLQEARINGKYTLIPMVRCDDEGVIEEGPISPDWIMASDEVVVSFSREFLELSRLDLPNMVLWRQQKTKYDIPILRTDYVTSTGIGLNEVEGRPQVDTIDLSRWCDDQDHAVKVAAWYHAARLRRLWQGTLVLRPGGHSLNLARGQILQVKILLTSAETGDYETNHFCRVENISRTPGGGETVAVSHWPVDEAGRGLMDMAFIGATGSGMMLPHPPAGACDDPGNASDTSVPPSSTLANSTFSGGDGGAESQAGTTEGSGGPGNGDTSTSEPPGIGGYSPASEPPKDTGGKKSKGSDKPRSTDWASPGSDECKPGKIKFYEWKLSQWITGGNQPGPEPSPGAYYAMQTLITRSDLFIKKVGDAVLGQDVPDVYHLDYSDANGQPVEQAVWFAWPLVVEQVSVTCGDNTNVPSRKHKVLPGDNLYNIAGKALGDPNRWPEIYQLNKKIINNPNLIFPGQMLKLPAS